MQPKRPNSMSTFAMLVTLGISAPLILAESQFTLVQAQDAPKTIRIDNLTRMAPINQALKKQYETQFSDTTVEIKAQQTDANLQLQNKQADLAAISRLLTPEEKAQGLVQVPVTREKIAIVVGQDNNFDKGLTIDQVTQIFQGKITDWSQIGGKSGPIRVIHRPIADNLQSTLQTYDLFREAAFEAGDNTVQLDQDSVTALATELGTDGISYILASQIAEAKSIRPVSMYQTLPDDPKYPFSQPFTYVYQGKPSSSTQAFLDYVVTEPGQQAIAEAKTQPNLFNDLDTDSTSISSTSSSTPDTIPSSNVDNPSEATNSPANSAANQDASNPDTPSSTDASGEEQSDSRGLGWLPVALILLVLGAVIGGILKTLLAKRKPKAPPRPAPNYAEKIRPTTIQGSSTQLPASPDSLAANIPPIQTANNALTPDQIGLGATTAGVAAAGAAETPSTPTSTSSVGTPQSSERIDITSEELRVQTHIQAPKTELQDTLPLARGPETQLQDPSPTQLQPFDDESAETGPMPLQNLGSTQHPNPSSTQLQDSSATQLQDSQQTWNQEEVLSQESDLNPKQLPDFSSTPLHDPSATRLQNSNPTQLQDLSPAQLQDSNPTQLQEPQHTWTKDEAFFKGMDPSSTQLQDSSPTQLQDPKQTWIQDEEFPKGLDPSQTQLQDPSQTWTQDEASPQRPDPSSTQLQDLSTTQRQDPSQTWIQDD